MFESVEQDSQFALPHTASSGFTTPAFESTGGSDDGPDRPDWPDWPDVASCADVQSAWFERELAELELVMVVWGWARSDGHVADGSINASAWLKGRLGISHGQARELLWFAKGLHRYRELFEAIRTGRLSSTKAKSLLRVFTEPRDEYAVRDIEALIGHATKLTVNQVRLIAKAWAARVDAEIASTDPDQPTIAPVTSELFLSEIIDGIVELKGTLAPDDGEVLRTAMDLALKMGNRRGTSGGGSGADGIDHEDIETGKAPEAQQGSVEPSVLVDERTAAQRRADALVLIAQFFLDFHNNAEIVAGTSGRERPHVHVTVNLETLKTNAGIATATHGGNGLTAETALRMCCDANIHRIITHGKSEVIDIGRSSRLIPPALFKAIRLRDVHCRFPGCDMPHQFVQIHHVKHWVHGGHTDRDNLIMLCGFHHRLIHITPGWVISGSPNQRLIFTNPNNKKYFSEPPGIHLLTG